MLAKFTREGIGGYLRRKAIMHCMQVFEEDSLEIFIERDRNRNTEILMSYASGMTQDSVAKKFGMTHPAIWAITEKYLRCTYPKLEALIEERIINGSAND